MGPGRSAKTIEWKRPMSLIIFLVILGVLVIVHEWEHFITAKKLGVKVEQFAVGFGQKIFSKVHDGTEYRLCAIPLGGYVKMAGDERSQCQGKPWEFFSKSPGHRALIVLMGPVVNFVFAYGCLYFTALLGTVDQQKTSENFENKVPGVIGQVIENTPAQKAGLKEGDRIIQINETPIKTWRELQTTIAASKVEKLKIIFDRHGQVMTQDVFSQERTSHGKTIRVIGVAAPKTDFSPTKEDIVILPSAGIFGSFVKAGEQLATITLQTYSAVGEIFSGKRSAKETLTGPVGMYSFVQSAVAFFKFGPRIGFSFLLFLVGVISASLAIFNLFPIVPLDGGHLFFLGIERLRGRTLSARADEMIARVGFSLMITLALFIFYVDFERIGLIEKVMSFWTK